MRDILECILIILTPFIAHFLGWLLYKLTICIEDYQYKRIIKLIIKMKGKGDDNIE